MPKIIDQQHTSSRSDPEKQRQKAQPGCRQEQNAEIPQIKTEALAGFGTGRCVCAEQEASFFSAGHDLSLRT